GRDFIGGQPSCLVLGDNIFYGHGLTGTLKRADARKEGATVFGYYVSDPERYGVAELDASGKGINIEEKPEKSRSNYAVTALYFYDRTVRDRADSLRPSLRCELELTDLNPLYLDDGALSMAALGRDSAWLDTGTHQSLLQAAAFIETIEARQG